MRSSTSTSEHHLREIARLPERTVPKPQRADALALARRVFTLAVLGILVFVALSIALTGVRIVG